MSKLLDKALQIATEAHKDQAGEDYIKHPMFVSSLVDAEYEKATALLHDVVEDSSVTFEDLENHGVPYEVVEALKTLTKGDKEDYFDYLKRVKQNELARKVKLADLSHNSDTSRLRTIANKDKVRLEKYKKAIEYLS